MAEELNDGGRVAYLEARVGELHQKIGDLREQLAKAVAMVKTCTGHPDTGRSSHFELIQRERASRQAWAEEAIRQHCAIEKLTEPAPWDLNHPYIDGGSGDPEFHGACCTCGSEYDDELHEEPYGQRPADPEPNAPCACLADDVTLPERWVRPQCAVHPDGETA